MSENKNINNIEMADSGQEKSTPSPPAYTEVDPSKVPTVNQPTAATTTNMGYSNTTYTVQPVVIGNMVLPNMVGPIPHPYVCPSCHQQIVTRVEAQPTMKQHIFASALCVLGFWPCAPIPYCMPSCRKADHYCPFCNAYIGTYRG